MILDQRALHNLRVGIIGALARPAVFNFVFAERYQQAPHQVAAIVLVGNIAAILVMPLVLAAVL